MTAPLRYNVVLVEPPGYVYNRAFVEIAQLVLLSLRSLGFTASASIQRVDPDAMNVLLGYHVLPGTVAMSRAPCIVYQLEQLSFRDSRFPESGEKWLELLRAAHQVWDYSHENIELLRSHGFDGVKHLPIGYHEGLEVIPKSDEQDVDVLFYGQLNDRRRHVLKALRERCRMKYMFGVYGPDRDAWIARSKIVLNMHMHDAEIFEQARVSFLLNNGRFVVSEDAPDNPYAGGLVTAPYDKLVETCVDYLARDDDRRRIARQGYDLFRARPMVEHLHAIVGSAATEQPKP
jgi:hypothetical protein